MVGAEADAGADAGEGVREVAQRNRIGRDRAAVGAPRRGREVEAGGGLQRRGDALHHRMVRADVAAGEAAQVDAAGQAAGDAEKAGVLARAVVVQGARLDAGRRHLPLDRLAIGPVRAALERVGVEPGARQHAGDDRGVLGLAVVRSAGDGQLLVAQAELVGGAAGHERQGLQHFHRRAREHRALDVAERCDRRAVGIDDGDRAAMRRFADAAAHRFDQDRVHQSARWFGGRPTVAAAGDAPATATAQAAGDNRPHVGHGPGPRPLRRAAARALERRRQAHRRRCPLRPDRRAVPGGRLGAARHLGGLGRGAALRTDRMGGAARERDRPRLLLHDPAARLPPLGPHRRLPGGARHRSAAGIARRAALARRVDERHRRLRRRRRRHRRLLHRRRAGPLGQGARSAAAGAGARRHRLGRGHRRADRRLHR